MSNCAARTNDLLFPERYPRHTGISPSRLDDSFWLRDKPYDCRRPLRPCLVDDVRARPTVTTLALALVPPAPRYRPFRMWTGPYDASRAPLWYFNGFGP